MSGPRKQKAFNPAGPFTSGQLAKLFHVSARTVTKWIDAGALEGYQIPLSRDRRATRAALEAFLAAHPKFPRPAELGERPTSWH